MPRQLALHVVGDHALSSLLVILAIAAATPIIADLPRRIRVPAVVVEIVAGIAVGPHALGLVHLGPLLDVLAEFGLATLIFLAGFEIDIAAIKGKPLRLASLSWLGSLGIALAIGAVLAIHGVVISGLVVGLALTSTALGTLLPILRDRGELGTPFGVDVLASGAVGEFGPIVAVALVLTASSPARTTAVLVAFAAVTAAAVWIALRPRSPRVGRLVRTSFHTSGQLAVRFCVLMLAGLVWVAEELGLDILLGAFAAGLVMRLFLTGHGSHPEDAHDVGIRLEAIGFGFLIPLFFVVSGVRFDLPALSDAATLAKVPLYLALMLVARGLPTIIVYRRHTRGQRELWALGLLTSTALPLIVAITTIGLSTGELRPGNAAALVGAGLVSVLAFPLIAFAVKGPAKPD